MTIDILETLKQDAGPELACSWQEAVIRSRLRKLGSTTPVGSNTLA